MKDLEKIKLNLVRQIEHLVDGVFLHKSENADKIFKQLQMDNTHPLSSHMVVRSLEVNKDPFRTQEGNEKPLDPEVPYHSAISAFMYLAYATMT